MRMWPRQPSLARQVTRGSSSGSTTCTWSPGALGATCTVEATTMSLNSWKEEVEEEPRCRSQAFVLKFKNFKNTFDYLTAAYFCNQNSIFIFRPKFLIH